MLLGQMILYVNYIMTPQSMNKSKKYLDVKLFNAKPKETVKEFFFKSKKIER